MEGKGNTFQEKKGRRLGLGLGLIRK
jgi:hypothetical protein